MMRNLIQEQGRAQKIALDVNYSIKTLVRDFGSLWPLDYLGVNCHLYYQRQGKFFAVVTSQCDDRKRYNCVAKLDLLTDGRRKASYICGGFLKGPYEIKGATEDANFCRQAMFDALLEKLPRSSHIISARKHEGAQHPSDAKITVQSQSVLQEAAKQLNVSLAVLDTMLHRPIALSDDMKQKMAFALGCDEKFWANTDASANFFEQLNLSKGQQ